MSQPVAFVTGCSSGIGRALADAFQRAGYRVWASARKEDDVRALAEEYWDAVLEANPSLADPATAAVTAVSAHLGAWGVRVHEVDVSRDAVDVAATWRLGADYGGA